MSARRYIVPNELLYSWLLEAEWHAHAIPADPSKSFVVVDWKNLNREIEFESLAGVLPLGDLWDLLPAEAVPLLESMQQTVSSKDTAGVALPVTDPLSAPDTVNSALQKISWAGSRLFR